MLSPIYPASDYQKAHQAEHMLKGFLANHGMQFFLNNSPNQQSKSKAITGLTFLIQFKISIFTDQSINSPLCD